MVTAVVAAAAAAVTPNELLSLLLNKHIEFNAHAICAFWNGTRVQ